MIQDSDKDILDNDLHQWTISIRDSIRSQIIDCIHKREFAYTQNLKGYEIHDMYPFIATVYVQYRTTLSKLFIPLAIPLEVFVVSDDTENIEYCVNSAFDILLNKMRSGFEVIGNSQNTHDYRYFFPIASASIKSLESNSDPWIRIF